MSARALAIDPDDLLALYNIACVTERKMQAYFAEFPAQAKPSDEHTHAGAEIVYVLSGQLAVSIDGNETILTEGDAMYFDSGVPHSYRQQGRAVCSAIVVVTP